MDKRSIARRYAKALFQLAKGKKQTDKLSQELSLFEQPSLLPLVEILDSPLLVEAEKQKIINELSKSFSFSPLTKQFCLTLIDAHRCSLLPFAATEFSQENDKLNKRQQGVLYSSEPLNKKDSQRISAVLGKILARTVVLENRVDQNLLAGVKVVVGSKVFDNSLQRKLELLKESFPFK